MWLYNRDDDSSSVPVEPAPPSLSGVVVPFAISSVIVLGRVISRLSIVRSWGHDDTTIIAAWVVILISLVLLGLSSSNSPTQERACAYYNYASFITYFVSVFFTKLSILLFYLRILPATGSGCRRTGRRTCEPGQLWNPRLLTKLTICILICYSIPLVISSSLACSPQTPGKSYLAADITCVPLVPLLYTNAALNVVSDIWLLFIIVPSIIGLQLMRPRQKAALIVLFAGGALLVIIAGLVRVIEIAGTIATEPSTEWKINKFNFWTSIELSTGLACASLPGLVPLLRKMAPGVMGSIMGDSVKGSNSNAAAPSDGAWSGAQKSDLTRQSKSSKSRASKDENGAVLELHGGSKNQSVIRCFAKGGKQAVRFGAQPSKKTTKMAWFSPGWREGDKSSAARRQPDNESQEDVLPAREGNGDLRPDTGIVKTSEVVITESRVHNCDDDWP